MPYSRLLAQVFTHGRRGWADGFDRCPKLIRADAQGLGPILQLVVFIDVDPIAVWATRVLLVISHGDLLDLWLFAIVLVLLLTVLAL
ncbi:hypothetical protein Xvtw_19915 [Xanthomonas campestris pv. vitiswoodrowii]|nr:hypothetical protein Xvtw_19915 [Xanthomonas campestris pv. vitiswoodrowii]